jgi:hypothetical protein
MVCIQYVPYLDWGCLANQTKFSSCYIEYLMIIKVLNID